MKIFLMLLLSLLFFDSAFSMEPKMKRAWQLDSEIDYDEAALNECEASLSQPQISGAIEISSFKEKALSGFNRDERRDLLKMKEQGVFARWAGYPFNEIISIAGNVSFTKTIASFPDTPTFILRGKKVFVTDETTLRLDKNDYRSQTHANLDLETQTSLSLHSKLKAALSKQKKLLLGMGIGAAISFAGTQFASKNNQDQSQNINRQASEAIAVEKAREIQSLLTEQNRLEFLKEFDGELPEEMKSYRKENQRVIDYLQTSIYLPLSGAGKVSLIAMFKGEKNITRVQADLVLSALKSSPEGDSVFDVATIVDLIYQTEFLTPMQQKVAEVILSEGRNGNDFGESVSLAILLTKGPITTDKADKLIQIFRNSRYNNGVNDTAEFLEELDKK